MTETDPETEAVQARRDFYATVRAAITGGSENHVSAVAAGELSLNKLRLLHMLSRPHRRPPTITRVASLLGMEVSPAARLVDQLDDARLVDRVPDDENRRLRRVVITARGRAVTDELDHVLLRNVDRFARTLRGDERQLLDGARAVARRPDVAALRPPADG